MRSTVESTSTRTGWMWLCVASLVVIGSIGCQRLDYNTTSGPTELGCGGYERIIRWKLTRPAWSAGWVVQQVDMDVNSLHCNDSVKERVLLTYWEAWPVAAGASAPNPAHDLWREPNHGVSKGGWRWFGEARFYPGVRLPPGMTPNNPDTFAGSLPSTTVQPPWWGGGRTVTREVAYEWDCCDFNLSDRIIDTHDR